MSVPRIWFRALLGQRKYSERQRRARAFYRSSATAHWRDTTHGTRQAMPSRILHHPVIDLAVAQRDDIEGVILVQPPRPLRALFRQFRDGALHIAGREIQPGHFGDGGIKIM